MYAPLLRLVSQLISADPAHRVLQWASPVPYFGDIHRSVVATVGINPSNREFVDAAGCELDGAGRRLTTLTSLGLADWSQISGADLSQISRWCTRYFDINPYRRWFDVLDRTLRSGGYSYYNGNACHLDLVALATHDKWGTLDPRIRADLTSNGRVVMAEIIRDSALSALILNGRSVVSEFERFSGVELVAERVPEWTLPRKTGDGVAGYMFTGTIHHLGGIDLGRPVTVYGYNHNLQSSFGVTSTVTNQIGQRMGELVAAPSD